MGALDEQPRFQLYNNQQVVELLRKSTRPAAAVMLQVRCSLPPPWPTKPLVFEAPHSFLGDGRIIMPALHAWLFFFRRYM